VPASSKTDPLLAKAKPVSDGGSASGITYLRKGRKVTLSETAVIERGVRRCERNSSADTKISEEGGGRTCLKCQSREPSLATLMKTMVRQVVPLQSKEVHGGADIHM